MPATHCDMQLLYEVRLTENQGWWLVHVLYGERLY